jgi:hypothetical protein
MRSPLGNKSEASVTDPPLRLMGQSWPKKDGIIYIFSFSLYLSLCPTALCLGMLHIPFFFPENGFYVSENTNFNNEQAYLKIAPRLGRSTFRSFNTALFHLLESERLSTCQ